MGALAAGIVSIPAAPAHAVFDTAADQAYFSYYGLGRARAKSYTGESPLRRSMASVSTEARWCKHHGEAPCTIVVTAVKLAGAGVASILVSRHTVLLQMQRSLLIK